RLAYTILRPTFLMEVWLSPIAGFDFRNSHARIHGRGRNPISWISMYDVARFAVISLGTPLARNATFELGGPEAISPLDAVRIFEEVGGRRFQLEFVSEEELTERLPRELVERPEGYRVAIVPLTEQNPAFTMFTTKLGKHY